ncbi:GLPGLI family protein [Flavobacterium sp.]|uniref:GLPGLI family protein n=1 Tax=Flavobacterium sp. TaxID=239 RepID=UPI003753116D
MKKNFILIISFCFIYSSSLFSQSKLKVEYNTTFYGDVFSKGSSKESQAVVSSTKGTEDKIKTLNFNLVINNNLSIFSCQQELVKDGETSGEKMGKLVAGYDDVFYKDIILKKLVSEKEVAFKRYKIDEEYDNFIWEYTTEEKDIQGYKCYLAKTKFLHLDVYAWYCPSLPYPFGPREFGSLPGLILELQKGKLVFLATKISFENVENINFDIDNMKTMSRKEINKIIEKDTENFLNGN